MKTHSITKTSFKGYDARPLKGFLMNSNPFGISNELKTIGEKEGFEVYSVIKGNIFNNKLNPKSNSTFNIWAQDMWSIVKNTFLTTVRDNTSKKIREAFNLTENNIQKTITKSEYSKNKHISGGNIFIVKGDNGDEILVGSDELKMFEPTEIMEMYSTNKITVIPQMDFHLDLFIRPLDKKRILLTDDMLTLDVLNKGKKKLEEYLATLTDEEKQKYSTQKLAFHTLIGDFEFDIVKNEYAQSDSVEKTLKDSGYEVIKVPGRLYESYTIRQAPTLVANCNYMNANVTYNNEGKLIYITNKSPIDEMLFLTPELSEKIGFSFENEFIKSISPYIEKEHIYFIEGDNGFLKDTMLRFYGGGIHCATMEIPKELKFNGNSTKD